MKFIVEIDDFWMDEEEELQPALQKYLIASVVQQISKSIEKKVEDKVYREAKNQIENQMYKQIQQKVSDIIATGKIRGTYSGGAEITLEEWIKEQFTSNTSYRSPTDELKKLADKFGKEIKDRYDLLFASQIVAKLNEQGMLKEDVAKMLFDKKPTH